jgi:hypothetical protein
VVNRPAEFSGAVGAYQVSTRAQPTELQAEDPLILTIRITGSGPLEKIERPDLRRLWRFAEHFAIQNLGERFLKEEGAREFDYRLRPRTAEVSQIPAFRFVYFKPGLIPDYRGYQTALAPAIPLHVRPRATVEAAEVEGPTIAADVPESVYQLAEGAAVLRQEEPFALPGSWLLALMLILPPGLCAAWYLAWQRAYPDQARRARRRRSRAAQQALRALRSAEALTGRERASQLTAAFNDYLRLRLNVPEMEPTATEVAAHLRVASVPADLVQEVTRFLEACDAARFGPRPVLAGENGAAAGTRLVLALEAVR